MTFSRAAAVVLLATALGCTPQPEPREPEPRPEAPEPGPEEPRTPDVPPETPPDVPPETPPVVPAEDTMVLHAPMPRVRVEDFLEQDERGRPRQELDTFIIGGERCTLSTTGGFFGATDPFCSGVMVAPNLVLTAAHCLRNGPLSGITFRTNGERRTLSAALCHAGFTERVTQGQREYFNDVAMVRLSAPIALTHAEVVDTSPPQVRIAGFGTTIATEEPTASTGRYCVTLQVAASHEGRTIARSRHDGGPNGNACFGDSGGGIYEPSSDGLRVIGLVSYVDQACAYYVVATRLSAFRTWIDSARARLENGASSTTCDSL